MPAEETSSAAVWAAGRSTRWRYCLTAMVAVACSGSARDFPPFPWRTVIHALLGIEVVTVECDGFADGCGSFS